MALSGSSVVVQGEARPEELKTIVVVDEARHRTRPI
jgi:hypothetical protein